MARSDPNDDPTTAPTLADAEQLRLVLDGSPIAKIVVDAAGRIVLVNVQLERSFGYHRDELLGEPIDRLVPLRYRTGHRGLRSGYLAAPSARPMGAGRELFGLRKDGTEFPIEIGLNSINTPGGMLVLAAIIDITERKAAERLRLENASELQRRISAEADRDRALDASSLKSQFVATMSHELRTPLNAIIGLGELLEGTALTERQRKYVDGITTSADALLAIINSILDFSKIEAGKIDLERREFSLEPLIEGTAELLAHQVRSKGLALHTFIDPDLPAHLIGDPDRVRQVLLNIIGNAVKFTATGRIVVEITLLRMGLNEAVARFAVHDTGIGITGPQLATLFEPFVQADQTPSRAFGGTGLGLSICKRLVTLMGGQIGATSVPGSGSEFWFTIPFGRSTPTTIAQRAPGAHALVLSDDEAFVDILTRYLVSWGISFSRIAVDRDGLSIPNDAAGDDIVAIADIESPRVAAIADALGRLPRVRLVPIGDDCALTKPMRRSQLFNEIVKALGTRHFLPPEPQGSDPPPLPLQPVDRERARILVAEDNEQLRGVLDEQFQRLGLHVLFVNDGLHVVDAAAGGAFDMIFMDCQMPGMDGLSATRAIRADEAASGAHVPIVAITANAFKEDRDACLAAGMDDYLTKPLLLEQIATTVARWLPAARPQRV
jgi:PAS domain S-box-containing protein